MYASGQQHPIKPRRDNSKTMKKLYLLLITMLTGLAVHACTASFSGTQSPSGSNLLNVVFTNSSSYGTPFTGQAKKATIRYGDGNSATVWSAPLPAHNYAAPGSYTAKLIVWSIDSSTMNTICADSTTITVAVAYPACGTVLSVSGTGATRSFTASNPAGTTGISYSWDYGDGSTLGTGSNPSHTYTTSGFYTFTCTSTVSSPACSYVNTLSVYVLVPAPALYCSTLSANFTAAISSGTSNVTLTNTSTTVSFPYSRNVFVDWGDGSSNTGTTHAYTAVGTYTIKMKVEWLDSVASYVYCRDSISKSVSITALSPGSIQGYIMYDSSFGINPAMKVWLIQFNSTTNILSAVDSQSLPATAAKYYAFYNKTVGNYLVKAAIVGGPTSGSGNVPTYSYSSATWNTATSVSPTPGSISYAHISMIVGTVTTGPGFVGGNVSLGANKGASGGVAGMTMLLRDAANKVIKWATTNSNGDYSFSNVPIGTYTVYPESMNYATTPATITISAGSPTVGNISFNQDDVKMSLAPRALSVGAQSANAVVWSVYPNPASNKLTVTWKGLTGADAGLNIIDIAGKTVLEQQLIGGTGAKTIDISSLRSGLYFAQGTGALSGTIEKLVVE
jgi:PKD repeat protein